MSDKKQCDTCSKWIKKSNFARHKQTHQFQCTECPASFTSSKKLTYHSAAKHSTKSSNPKFHCFLCDLSFLTFNRLSYHKRITHGENRQKSSENVDLYSFQCSDPHFLQELRSVQHFLVDSKIEFRKKTVYNFRLTEYRPTFINEKLSEIFNELNCAVKINLSLGFVLHDLVGTQDYRYFYPADNNPLFQLPLTLANKEDLDKLKNKIEQKDLFNQCLSHRPNSQWKFFRLTNFMVFVFHLTDVPLGCQNALLPQALIKHPLIKTFLSDSDKKPYHDNLCFFRAVAFEKFGSDGLAASTKYLLSEFLSKTGKDSKNFTGVLPSEIHEIEQIVQMNLQVYSIGFDEKQSLIGELSHQSANLFSDTVSLLQYDNHICWTKNIDKFLQKYRCRNCDKFWSRSFNFQRHIRSCSERITHRYPTGPYQLNETVFEKMRNLDIEVEDYLFKNLVVFDFESITVHDQSLNHTDSTTFIGKHVPISVSIHSNLISEPIFICDINPRCLITKFLLELLALSKRSSMELRQFFDPYFQLIHHKINELNGNLPQNADDEIDDEASNLKLLRNLKKLYVGVKIELERYCDNLPVFGFNSSRYDLNLIKEYLLEILLIDFHCSPSVIKSCNKYIAMNFMGLQFLDILNFLGGATSLDKFLKAYGTSEQKGFFPYEWFDDIEKLRHTDLPIADAFYSKLKNCNVLETEFNMYNCLIRKGMPSSVALKKLGLISPPQGKEQNYQDLREIWRRNHMETFQDFLKWYNNKDVVPTLEALQKMMQFYHQNGIDMLKLGSTLPNLANRILHSSTSLKFFPFNEEEKKFDDYIREWLTGGPSIIFTRYAKVGSSRIKNSSNICKTIVGIDASQLYPFSMMKDMPTGVYTKWELREDTGLFHPRRSKKNYLECIVLKYFQTQNPHCYIQSQFNQKSQKRIGAYLVDGFCSHCNTVFEVLGCYWHFCPCQEKKRLPIDEIEKGLKRREYDECRRKFLLESGFKLCEIWECDWWKKVKNNVDGAGDYMKTTYPYQKPISENKLIEDIKSGLKFGVVDCSIEVPERLREKFSEFPPIFKNCEVSLEDIGSHMKDFAHEHNLLKKPRRMLISSFRLQRGPLITPLLQFYLEKGLVLIQVYWFIQYTPEKCFESFVNSVVEARREGDKNTSSVVAETMKLIGNSSYGYQIMDRSKHSKTQYVVGAEVDKLVNERNFKNLNVLPSSIYEVEMVKSEVNHKEPIIVGFFILQYAKLTMLQLFYIFFQLFCDSQKYELIEMDTDSLYMALSEDKIEDLIRPEMKLMWEMNRENDCRDDFRADEHYNFFTRNCCQQHWKFDQRTPGLFKEEFRCTEMVALCSKTYCCFDEPTRITKLSCKGLNKDSLNDEPINKYRAVLEEKERVITCNRGFRVVGNSKVCTYELKKNGLSYFYPKRIVLSDGIHTKPLNI